VRYTIEQFENAVICSWRNYLSKKHKPIGSVRSLYFNCARSAIVWYFNRAEFKVRPKFEKLLEKFKEIWSTQKLAAPIMTEGYARFRLLANGTIRNGRTFQIGMAGLELIIPIPGTSVEVITTIGGASQNQNKELKNAIVFIEENIGKTKFLNSWEALFVKIGFSKLAERPPNELNFQTYNLLRGWKVVIPMSRVGTESTRFLPTIAKRLEAEEYIPNPNVCNCKNCRWKTHCSFPHRSY